MLINRFKELAFTNFNDLFVELEGLSQNTDDSEGLPEVELSLRSGNIVRGIVLNFIDSNNQKVVKLLQPSDTYSKSEVTFVYASQVVSLRILEADEYLKKHVNPAPQREVGLLELKRASRTVEENLGKHVSSPIVIKVDFDGLAEKHRSDILRTIETLPFITEKLASDDLGKNLLKEAIDTIEIMVGDKGATSLQDKKLSLQIVSPLKISSTKEKERLLQEIESLL